LVVLHAEVTDGELKYDCAKRFVKQRKLLLRTAASWLVLLRNAATMEKCSVMKCYSAGHCEVSTSNKRCDSTWHADAINFLLIGPMHVHRSD